MQLLFLSVKFQIKYLNVLFVFKTKFNKENIQIFYLKVHI